jgi:NRPS condensation-like uncharacterized protein
MQLKVTTNCQFCLNLASSLGPASQLVFVVSPGSSLSLQRLNRALALLVNKDPTLRTRLTATSDGSSRLQQCVVPFDDIKINSFVQVSKIESADEETNRTHFDLTTGRIFGCHAIRRSNEYDEDLLTVGDMLLFNFHHAIFDHFSESIFLADLREAYSTSSLDGNDDHAPIYIDFTFLERDSRDDNALSVSDFEDHLQLPYDRRPSTPTRTGRASLVNLKLDRGESLVTFACQAQITLFQVYLSAYYVFLYKLTQCQDLIVDSRVTDQSRYEVTRTISMFNCFIPFRLRVEPEKSFVHLIELVKMMTHPTVRNTKTLPYMTIGFRFQTITSKIELIEKCELVRCIRPPNVTKHDLCLSIEVNESKQLTGSFVYSCDVFDEATLIVLARRFESLLDQLLSLPSTTPNCEFSLLLPHEIQAIHQLNADEQLPLHKNLLFIHQQFAHRAEEHMQKLAVVLDDQSLTYAELLYSSQLLARHLTEECHVQSGDIIAQCIERSIEMVS